MPTHSVPERLDAAVDRLLAGESPWADAELRPLVAAAGSVAEALRPIPVSPQFEARLATRLLHDGRVRRAADAVTSFTRRELAHPGRLLAAGAVSSAAVGVTVTAFAVWRSTRRNPPPMTRLLPR